MNRCYYSNCSNESDLICECIDSKFEFCEFHAHHHLQQDANHNLKSTGHRITYDEKVVLTAHLLESLRKLKEIRNKIDEKVKENIQKITKIMMESFNHIREQENLINKALERLSLNDQYKNTENLPLADSFILKYLNNPSWLLTELNAEREKMIEEIASANKEKKFWEFEKDEVNKIKNDFEKKLNEMQQDINELSQRIHKQGMNFRDSVIENKNRYEKQLSVMRNSLAFLNPLNGNDIIDEEFPPGHMHFFENGTKDLCVVNPFAETDMKYPLNIADSLSLYSGFCEIPKTKEIFYCGGDQGTFNYTYIINLAEKTAVKKSPCKAKSYIGACAYSENENCVYIFGGFYENSKITAQSEKYNIAGLGCWSPIEPMPAASGYNSCGLIGQTIFITGYNLKLIYKYDIATNNYKECGSLTSSYHKVLIAAQEIVYVFENGKLYKSSSDDYKKYIQANDKTEVPNKHLISYPIRCGKGVYFVLEDRTIYRLDLLSDQVIKIKKLKF